MQAKTLTRTQRRTYRVTIVIVAALNLADLVTLIDLPDAASAALFALNTLLFLSLYNVSVKQVPVKDERSKGGR